MEKTRCFEGDLATEQRAFVSTTGPVAQRIRHLTTNQGIPGSNPGRIVFVEGAEAASGRWTVAKLETKYLEQLIIGPVAQWIRRLTSNQKILGSSPSRVEEVAHQMPTY